MSRLPQNTLSQDQLERAAEARRLGQTIAEVIHEAMYDARLTTAAQVAEHARGVAVEARLPAWLQRIVAGAAWMESLRLGIPHPYVAARHGCLCQRGRDEVVHLSRRHVRRARRAA